MINQEIPTLTSSRIILRALNLNDAKSIFAYASSKAVAQYLFWDTHKTIDDSINFINEILKTKELTWGIQLKDNPAIIGTCGFIDYNPITKCLKLGYALNQNYWNQGYTKEALMTIINYAFKNLDVIRIEGICVKENIASEKTMLSCNMIFEGILHDNFIKGNEIHDCKIFAITKRNYLTMLKP